MGGIEVWVVEFVGLVLSLVLGLVLGMRVGSPFIYSRHCSTGPRTVAVI